MGTVHCMFSRHQFNCTFKFFVLFLGCNYSTFKWTIIKTCFSTLG